MIDKSTENTLKSVESLCKILGVVIMKLWEMFYKQFGKKGVVVLIVIVVAKYIRKITIMGGLFLGGLCIYFNKEILALFN